ncbi:DUF29 domain-containing protein [Allochromatium palmeri]|uniref:DUF29 family protein n=1 Tax=Allochromatium palmeri TaxID=231048 RepID=A0A6N8EDR3_9GAMM|nr:DUF29 domain-containing protein [Allochromatium palmeri]MTW20637.1 DUF29 family protein [Allochromatium palmeri]
MNYSAEIYERDFDAWVQSQVFLLRQGKTGEIDVEHLIEELEEMGKSNLRELESRFIILIAHLLKWQFQLEMLAMQWKEFEGKSWRKTIIEQRTQISFLIKKVPSLKSSLHLAMTEAYTEARRLAIKETALAPEVFPIDCPYSVEQLFDEDFYPDCSLSQRGCES